DALDTPPVRPLVVPRVVRPDAATGISDRGADRVVSWRAAQDRLHVRGGHARPNQAGTLRGGDGLRGGAGTDGPEDRRDEGRGGQSHEHSVGHAFLLSHWATGELPNSKAKALLPSAPGNVPDHTTQPDTTTTRQRMPVVTSPRTFSSSRTRTASVRTPCA